jgi:hypothetical protein
MPDPTLLADIAAVEADGGLLADIAAVEAEGRPAPGPGSGVMAPHTPTVGDVFRRGLDTSSVGKAITSAAGTALRLTPLGDVASGAEQGANDLAGMLALFGGQPDVARDFRRQSQRAEDAQAFATQANPVAPEWPARMLRGASRSLTTSLPGAVIAGPGGAILAGMGQGAASTYLDRLDAGDAPDAALAAALRQAGYEGLPAAIMQRLGLGGAETLLADAFRRGGTPAVRDILMGGLKAGAQEIPEELVTTNAELADLAVTTDRAPSAGDVLQANLDTIGQAFLAPNLISTVQAGRRLVEDRQADQAERQALDAAAARAAAVAPGVAAPAPAGPSAQDLLARTIADEQVRRGLPADFTPLPPAPQGPAGQGFAGYAEDQPGPAALAALFQPAPGQEATDAATPAPPPAAVAPEPVPGVTPPLAGAPAPAPPAAPVAPQPAASEEVADAPSHRDPTKRAEGLFKTIQKAKEQLKNRNLHAGTRRSLLKKLPRWESELDALKEEISGAAGKRRQEIAKASAMEAAGRLQVGDRVRNTIGTEGEVIYAPDQPGGMAVRWPNKYEETGYRAGPLNAAWTKVESTPAPAPTAPAAQPAKQERRVPEDFAAIRERIEARMVNARPAKKPGKSQVFMDAMSSRGKKLGTLVIDHNGTPQDMIEAKNALFAYAENVFDMGGGEFLSNAGSRFGATDDQGNPVSVITPNNQIYAVDSPQARDYLGSGPEKPAEASVRAPAALPAPRVGMAASTAETEQQRNPFKGYLWQGRGATLEQVYGPEAVAEGRAAPLFGKAQYYAQNEEDAKVYGAATRHTVELRNPFVLDSDAKWRQLLRSAKAEHLDNMGELFYKEPREIPKAGERAQEFLRSKGYDGIIVRLDQDGDSTKRLASMAAHDQVVKFEPKAPNAPVQPVPAPAVEAAAVPAEPRPAEAAPVAEAKPVIPASENFKSTSPAAPKPPPETKPEPAAEPSARIEDVGEKIGGARKDRITLEDMEAMSDEERQAAVKRSAVWPEPDPEALIAEGATAEGAWTIMRAYGGIAKVPQIDKKDAGDPAKRNAALRTYIETVGRLRDALAKARTPEDVAAVLKAEWPEFYQRGMVSDYTAYYAARDRYQIVARGNQLANAHAKKRQMQTDLAAGWPNKAAWQSRYEINESYDRSKPGWRVSARNDRVRYQERAQGDTVYPTRAEAEAEAQRRYDAIKGKGGTKEPTRPLNPDAKRQGAPRRDDDRDVTAEELRDTFGFRGVEFGNWSNQADRQQGINQAYDALHDLAELMGVPPKALSLNGALGLAFGARGGGKFAAHYEPGKVVINLTRTRGAGALAHEWGHGVDNYFGKMGAGGRLDAYGSGEDAKNQDPAGKAGVRPEVVEAWRSIRKAMMQGDDGKASTYAKESRAGGDYWSRPTEMFARAFETWAAQRIADTGGASPYLVQGVPIGEVDLATATEWARRYPLNNDAKRISAAIDAWTKTLKTEETDKGVRLFAPERGLDREEPTTAADEGPTRTDMPGKQPAPPRPERPEPDRIPVAPIAPVPGADAGRVTGSIGDVMRRLREEFNRYGVGDPQLAAGETPAGAAGMFDEATGVATLYRSNDLDAAAHELGHQVAWKFRFDTEDIPGETDFFAKTGSQAPPNLTGKDLRDYRAKEAWAEFIRAWMVNPEAVASQAPQMLDTFEATVPEPARKALADFGRFGREFLGLPAAARTQANIEQTEELVKAGSTMRAVATLFGIGEAIQAARGERGAWLKTRAFLAKVWKGANVPLSPPGTRNGALSTDEIKAYKAAIKSGSGGGWAAFRWAWQNVWFPAYQRYSEALAIRGRDVKPDQDFRVLNRLLSGTDGKVLEQVFGSGLRDSRNRPAVDTKTGETLTLQWMLDPLSKSVDTDTGEVAGVTPGAFQKLVNKALAYGVELRTAGRGTKLIERAAQEAERFVTDLDAFVQGTADLGVLDDIEQRWTDAKLDPGAGRELRIVASRLTKMGGESGARDAKILRRFTEAYGERVRKIAAEKAARLSGIGAGLTSDFRQAQAAIAERAKDPDLPAMDEFLRRYRRWAQHLVQYLTETGVFDAEKAQKMLDSDTWTDPDTGEVLDFYIDMHRIFERDGSAIMPGRAFTGSTRSVRNPLANLLEATLNAIANGDRNRAMAALADAFRNRDAAGRIQDDVRDARLGEWGRQVPEETVQEARKSGLATINGRIPYLIKNNGVREFWTFDPWVEASIEAARRQGGDGNLLLRTWAALTRTMRTGIVTYPSFMIRNLMRDLQARFVVSESASGMGIADVFKGFGSITADGRQEKVNTVRKLAGASYAGYNDGRVQIGQALAQHLDSLIRPTAGGKVARVISPQSLLRLTERMGEASEALNRNAEMVSAYRRAKEELGYDDFNAQLYAADKTRGLIDFAEAGVFSRQLNRAILFVNPAIQGLARFARTWNQVRERVAKGETIPEKAWNLLTARAVVSMGLMTAAAIAIRMMKDDKEEEKWRQQDPTVRDFHWHIPMEGFSDLAIPRPYDFGFLIAGAERIADAVMAMRQGDQKQAERAMDGYTKSATGALLPINDVSSMLGGFAPLIEAGFNFDTFRQRHIIPTWEEGSDLRLRDTDRASWLGKQVQGITGQDARIADHIIEGYAGNWGRAATSVGKPADWWLGSVTGLFKTDPAGAARDVQWVYDEATRLRVGGSREVRAMTALLKQARSGTTIAERQRLAERARLYAANLRNRWEKNPPRKIESEKD